MGPGAGSSAGPASQPKSDPKTDRAIDRSAESSVAAAEVNRGPVTASSNSADSGPNTAPEVQIAMVRGDERAEALRDVPETAIPEALETLTTEMMRRCDFPCRCEVVPGEYHHVKLVTDDRSAGKLIGRHGATVDAVEHLVERMAAQARGERVRMNLDINNYRRKREAMLVERVANAVMQVTSTGERYVMEPLCARERRIVHMEVLKTSKLKTYTTQGESGKRVIIASEKSDEPDGLVESDNLDRGADEADFETQTTPSDPSDRSVDGQAEMPETVRDEVREEAPKEAHDGA